ncbi:MAG TPA: glutathione S-transferase family protein [Polyangiaceae bacterium]
MTIKIYGPRMGSALRTHWVAAELGTAYEGVSVDFGKGENRSDWFLKINPMGQVPALVDGDFSLAESMAICSYLIDLAGSDLGGKTPQERATAWRWSLWAALNVQPHLSNLASPAWTQQPLAPEIEAAARATLAKHLPVLEGHLASNAFVTGGAFSVGDINVAAVLGYAAYAQYDMTAYPTTKAWLAKVTARPSHAAAMRTPA